jgi:hypothetical protein
MRVLVRVEEVRGAQVLVTLLVLGVHRAGVEADPGCHIPVLADAGVTGHAFERAVHGDRAPEVLDVESGMRASWVEHPAARCRPVG